MALEENVKWFIMDSFEAELQPSISIGYQSLQYLKDSCDFLATSKWFQTQVLVNQVEFDEDEVNMEPREFRRLLSEKMQCVGDQLWMAYLKLQEEKGKEKP